VIVDFDTIGDITRRSFSSKEDLEDSSKLKHFS